MLFILNRLKGELSQKAISSPSASAHSLLLKMNNLDLRVQTIRQLDAMVFLHPVPIVIQKEPGKRRIACYVRDETPKKIGKEIYMMEKTAEMYIVADEAYTEEYSPIGVAAHEVRHRVQHEMEIELLRPKDWMRMPLPLMRKIMLKDVAVCHDPNPLERDARLAMTFCLAAKLTLQEIGQIISQKNFLVAAKDIIKARNNRS